MLRILAALAVGLLATSLAWADQKTWEPVGLSGGGAMFNPAISPADPALAIVHCDMSAAYLTRDGGASWQMIHTAQLRSNIHCRAAFHPTDPKTIISPYEGGELRISRDGGTHWDTLARFNQELIGPLTLDPNDPDRMVVGVGTTIRLSSDSGKTWRTLHGPRGSFTGACFSRTIPGNRAYLAVATNQGVWVGPADGTEFDQATAGLPSRSVRSLSGGSKDGNTVLYCTLPGTDATGRYSGGVYRSRDLGQSWEPAMGKGLNLDLKRFDRWGENPIAQYYDVSTTDQSPATVWVTSGNTGVPPPHHATVYRSDDGGDSWRAAFFPDPRYPGFNVEKDYTVVEDGQFFQDRPQIAVDPRNPNHVLQINGGSCYFTTDGGVSWRCGHTRLQGQAAQRGAQWTNTGLVVTTAWHYYIDPHEARRHYICYTDIGFARSLDAGASWIWWSPRGRSPWPNTCYELAFDPDRPAQILGAFSNVHDIPNANIISGRHQSDGPGGICASDDFGATWKSLAGGLPAAPATAVVLDERSPAESRTLYAGFFEQGVYKSVDGGRSWAAKNTGLGDPGNLRVCRVQLHGDGTLFALVTGKTQNRKFRSAGAGLYRSIDGGDSWRCITSTVHAWWPKDFTLDVSESKTVYLSLCDANGEQCGGLYRTTDGGTTWNRLARLGPEHFSAALSPIHRGWIYATLCEGAPSFGLYLSKDDGKTFRPLAGLPFDNAMRITFNPADDTMLYVATFGGSVWKGPAE